MNVRLNVTIIIIKQAKDNKLMIVFIDLFKVSVVVAGLIDKGILCHNIGATIMNVRSPIVFVVFRSRT